MQGNLFLDWMLVQIAYRYNISIPMQYFYIINIARFIQRELKY